MSQAALAEEHVRSSDEPFELLYRAHAPTIYRYALGVLRNPADAEDIVQSTFTNAYRAMLGGERPERAENWLIKIAHNECRQRFRRLGRRATEVPLDEELAEPGTLEDQAETAGEIDGVLKALGELPFSQRTALVMREVAGRSATEIAHFLGTSVSSVDMLLFRARRTLRERSASVGTLALVPFPRSLLTFGGGSAAAKTAALAGGLGIMGKAAAVLVAGVVAAGAGSTGSKPQAGLDLPEQMRQLTGLRTSIPRSVREPTPKRAPVVPDRTREASTPAAQPSADRAAAQPSADRAAVAQAPSAVVPTSSSPAPSAPLPSVPALPVEPAPLPLEPELPSLTTPVPLEPPVAPLPALPEIPELPPPPEIPLP